MELGILGPLRVRSDGVDVAVSGAKRRALLALLLLDANRAVPADVLSDKLWGGEPPIGAAGTLQSHISHLRRSLGRGRIETLGRAYRLHVHPGELDADVFEAELTEGRSLLTAGSPADAATALVRALRRWRGPALGDFAGAAWASSDAARLDELRLVATESLLEARLADGQHAEVVAAAEAAIAEHPLRERLWAHLLVALYRDGRQADALRAYQRLREALAEELGIEPSPDLRALEASILAQDPALADAARSGGGRAAMLPSGVVTFLLTDVVGSTRLWESAPEAMATALARHDALIRGAVEAHGGSFLKARGEGDSTFSVFRRATDAVAAARTATLSLQAEPWPVEATIVVRAALHTGEANERDGDYYGRTVNRAARLRGAAEAGQMLLSRATADLVIDHLPADVRLEEVGTIVLPDLERAETVFLLVTDTTGARPSDPSTGPVPFPQRLGRVGAAKFVGRAEQLDLLHRRSKDVATGATRVVLLAGEPGIGKTSLAAEAARLAHHDGATVLFGRCDADVGVPYLPWIEALEQLVSNCDAGRLRELGARTLGDLARLVPSVVDRIAGVGTARRGDPDSDRYGLFVAVTAALAHAAAGGSLVLVLDDLHWADKPALVLLRHVVAAAPTNVLVIGTYRPSDLTVEHPLSDLLSTLRREPNVERVSLAGLADDEVVDLVESLAGQAISGAELGLVHTLHRETSGNPFFTLELLQHLMESGVVTRHESGQWTVTRDPSEVGLPESVREVVTRRIARLGEPVERVLEAAAVIGRTFPVDVLGAVVDAPMEDVLDALERAEAASLVTTVGAGELAFSHALGAHALYDALGGTRRARLHRRVAEAMEVLGLGAERVNELARHWGAGARPSESDKAIEYAMAAGRQALRALAPDEAVRWYTQALELADQGGSSDDERRCDLLLGLGRAQRQAGIAAFRDTLLEAARLADLLGDADRLSRAALANHRGFASVAAGVDAERVGILEAALARQPPDDTPTRARLLATLGSELAFDPDVERRHRLSDEALAAARRLGDAILLANVLALRFSAIWSVDTLEERRRNMTEARAAARAAGSLDAEAWVEVFAYLSELETGDREAADRVLDRLLALRPRFSQPFLHLTALTYEATRAIRSGDLTEATRIALAAVRLGTDLGDRYMTGIATGPLIELYWHQDRLDDIAALLATDDEYIADADVQRAAVAWRTGDEATAVRLLEAAMSDGTVERRGDFLWLPRTAFLAETAVHVGALGHARELYDALLPYADRPAFRGPSLDILVPHALGVVAVALGRPDDADAHFSRAIDLGRRMGTVFHTARAQAARGRALVARDDATAEQRRLGEQLLREALDAATTFGCRGVAQEAGEVLASLAPWRPPLPPPLRSPSIFPLAGRVAERALLDGAWREAAQGRRRVVLVAGEPGIGKSRLVQEVAQAVHGAGGWVVYARCDEELAAPYLPFAAILGALVDHAPEDVIQGHIGRCGGALAGLAPRLASRAGPLPPMAPGDSEVERMRLFEAVRDLVGAIARHAPLLLVLDDVHWADTSTLHLLRYVTISDPSLPLCIVATYRDAGAEMTDALAETLAALWRDPGVERIRLEGLDASDIAGLMDDLAEARLGEGAQSLARAILDRSAGNPFFVTELLRHVFETGTATRTGGRWAMASDIEGATLPASVRDVVLSRARRFGDHVERVLTLAAVVGRDFHVDVVSKLAERPGDEVLEAVERAAGGGLVHELPDGRGWFAFSHALVVDALLSTLSRTRAARLHRRLAELLEASDAAAAEVANRWISANEPARAQPWARRAGDDAAMSLAFDEAARWYGVALNLADEAAVDDDERFELLFRLGRAQRTAGMPTHRDTLLAAAHLAERSGDVDRLARAALANTGGGDSGFAPPDLERVEVLRRAIEAVGPGDGAVRARLLATLALELRAPTDATERRELATQALRMAERLGDPATVLRVLNLGYSALVAPETLDERLQTTARAVDLAVGLGDRLAEYWALSWRYVALLEAADVEAADRCLARIDELDAGLRTPTQPHLLFHRANRARLAGDLESSARLGAEARRLAAATGFAHFTVGDAALDARLRGRFDLVQDLLADVGPDMNVIMKAELAAAWIDLGRAADARALLDEAAADGFSETMLGYDVGARASWAMVAVALESPEHAATLYDLLAPWAGRAALTGSPVHGVVDHHLGALARVCGRHDAAREHLAAAEAIHERMGATYWLAATWLERAKVLLVTEGASDAVKALVSRVEAVAGERGFGKLHAEAVALGGASR